jgi:hypothetical protein
MILLIGADLLGVRKSYNKISASSPSERGDNQTKQEFNP